MDGDGGAIAASGASRVNLDGTSFRNNIASGAGGAISMTENSRLILGNRRIGGALLVTEFRENRAGNVGGAVSITGNIRQTLLPTTTPQSLDVISTYRPMVEGFLAPP